MDTIVSDQHMKEMTVGGSSSAILGGAAAVVLSILGLAGVVPHYMLTIAGIALGVGLLFEGGFIAAEYRTLLMGSGAATTTSKAELGGGLGAEAMAGVGAIVLGILALLGIVPHVLMSIASIVLGAGLMVGSGMMARLNALKLDTSATHETAKRVAKDAMSAATGLQALVGLAGIVLGILALIGVAEQTLNLVAMLALGSSELVSGGAITSRVLSFFG